MSALTKIILQRLGLGLLTLFVVSVIIAFVVELLPGDITQAILGQSATPETVAAFRAEIGLDRPAHIRYLEWLQGILTGEMGQSLANKREISDFFGARLSNTLFLGGVAAAISIPLALLLGVLAGSAWPALLASRQRPAERSAPVGAAARRRVARRAAPLAQAAPRGDEGDDEAGQGGGEGGGGEGG